MSANQESLRIERSTKELDAMKTILDAAHLTCKVVSKTHAINHALSVYYTEEAITILQNHLERYRFTINSLEPITGKRVIYGYNYYQGNPLLVQSDLIFVKMVIYVNEIFNSQLQHIAEKELKKIAKCYNLVE